MKFFISSMLVRGRRVYRCTVKFGLKSIFSAKTFGPDFPSFSAASTHLKRVTGA